MPAPINTLKADLAAGKQCNGCWIGLQSTYAAEIVAYAGFDWCLIDGEHSPNDLQTTLHQLQIIDPSPSAALVRVPVGDPVLIKQALDIGVQSILVPMVESGDQAALMVAATQYPPHGIRGSGPARASGYGAIPDYLTTAGEQICLLVQVESLKGVDALDDILATDGIDGVFIGPADLAADMGLLGQLEHPDVQAMIESLIKRIRAAGKSAGALSVSHEAAQRYIDWGANFCCVAMDVHLLASAARATAAKFKG